MVKKKYKKPLIIAEIGNNHEGSFNLARKYIKAASDCGVDAVKFQAIRPDEIVLKTYRRRYLQLKKFNLTFQQYRKLSSFAKKLKLKFGVSVFDIDSIKYLKPYVDFFKIASGDNNFFDLIKTVLQTKKKVIISLGLLNYKQINKLKKYVSSVTKLDNVTFLHCVTDYPVNPEEANLKSIPYLRDSLKINIGYSDHTLGITAPIIATTYGAKIIEKHFTLDNNQSEFRDHKISVDPVNMKMMVNEIEKTFKMLGSYKKVVSKREKKNLLYARRSLYLKRNIQKNEKITKDNLMILRPQAGIPLEKLKKILGKKSKKSLSSNTVLKINYLK